MKLVIAIVLLIVGIRWIKQFIKDISSDIKAKRMLNEQIRIEQAKAKEQAERVAIKQEKEIAKRKAEEAKRKAAELKRKQAEADLDYISVARENVIKLYGSAEAEFNNATTDRKKEAALNRMLSYDAKLRKLDKEREKTALLIA